MTQCRSDQILVIINWLNASIISKTDCEILVKVSKYQCSVGFIRFAWKLSGLKVMTSLTWSDAKKKKKCSYQTKKCRSRLSNCISQLWSPILGRKHKIFVDLAANQKWSYMPCLAIGDKIIWLWNIGQIINCHSGATEETYAKSDNWLAYC